MTPVTSSGPAPRRIYDLRTNNTIINVNGTALANTLAGVATNDATGDFRLGGNITVSGSTSTADASLYGFLYMGAGAKDESVFNGTITHNGTISVTNNAGSQGDIIGVYFRNENELNLWDGGGKKDIGAGADITFGDITVVDNAGKGATGFAAGSVASGASITLGELLTIVEPNIGSWAMGAEFVGNIGGTVRIENITIDGLGPKGLWVHHVDDDGDDIGGGAISGTVTVGSITIAQSRTPGVIPSQSATGVSVGSIAASGTLNVATDAYESIRIWADHWAYGVRITDAAGVAGTLNAGSIDVFVTATAGSGEAYGILTTGVSGTINVEGDIAVTAKRAAGINVTDSAITGDIYVAGKIDAKSHDENAFGIRGHAGVNGGTITVLGDITAIATGIDVESQAYGVNFNANVTNGTLSFGNIIAKGDKGAAGFRAGIFDDTTPPATISGLINSTVEVNSITVDSGVEAVGMKVSSLYGTVFNKSAFEVAGKVQTKASTGESIGFLVHNDAFNATVTNSTLSAGEIIAVAEGTGIRAAASGVIIFGTLGAGGEINVGKITATAEEGGAHGFGASGVYVQNSLAGSAINIGDGGITATAKGADAYGILVDDGIANISLGGDINVRGWGNDTSGIRTSGVTTLTITGDAKIDVTHTGTPGTWAGAGIWTDGGDLTINHTNSRLTVMDEIRVEGGGDLNIVGTGTGGLVEAYGNVRVDGALDIRNNGAFYLHGSGIFGEDVYVGNAGTLGGTGTIFFSEIFVGSGGTLSPGGVGTNRIGTLTVEDNITFGAGSTLLFEIDKNSGLSDCLVVRTGLVEIQEGARLHIDIVQDSALDWGDNFQYQVIKLEHGADFSDESQEFTLVGTWRTRFTSDIREDGYWVRWNPTAPRFSQNVLGIATPNAYRAAVAMDQIFSAGWHENIEKLYLAVGDMRSDDPQALADAFAQLHGEVFASNRTAAAHRVRKFQSLLPVAADRPVPRLSEDTALNGMTLGNSPHSDWKRWGTLTGDLMSRDSLGGNSGFSVFSGGFAVGTDRYISRNYFVGGAIGYSLSFHNFASIESSDVANSIHSMLYGGWRFVNTFADTYIGYSKDMHSTLREIHIGDFSGQARGKYADDIFTMGFGVGHRALFEKFLITPYFGAHFVYLSSPSVKEIGAGAADLIVEGDRYVSLRTPAGVKLNWEFEDTYYKRVWMPEVRVFCVREWGDVSSRATTSFAGAQNVSFFADGGNLQRDSLQLGMGVNTQLRNRMTFRMDCDFEIYKHTTVSSFGATLGRNW
jgi:uncharacterized protein with beta-barrel porin domain